MSEIGKMIQKKLEDAKTTGEYLAAHLWSYGIMKNDVDKIIDYAKFEIEKSGRISWDSPRDGYPKEMYCVLILVLKQKAIEWAEKHAPKAFWLAGLKSEI